MKIIGPPATFQKRMLACRRAGKTVGFVPTMGALHDGHMSLVRRARKRCDVTAVSIFVNPLQFGPGEDLARYPRTVKRDLALCAAAGVDYVFLPAAESLYPPDFRTDVNVGGLGDALCGKSRPGHFRGVTTVVAKLLNLAQCDRAFFGQKDAQQALIVKKMVRDLNLPVVIEICPIVREKDGLAMSSRNRFLNPSERQQAVALFRAIKSAEMLVRGGERRGIRIVRAAEREIKKAPLAKIDYVELRDAENLQPVKNIGDTATLLALAVFFGKTRLIDNTVLKG